MRPPALLRCAAALVVLAEAGPASANPPPAPPEPQAPPPRWMPRREAIDAAEVPVGKAVWRPGKGLEVASVDRRFTLNLNVWAQLLYTARREASPAVGMDPWSQSLELRRARAILSGNVFTPHVGYYVHLMFAPRDLGLQGGAPRRAPIFQWYATWTRYRHANLQAGFFFVPYARQRMQPLSKLQLPDNSSASYEFTLDQDIGVQLSSPDVAGLGKLRYFAGVFMGDGYNWYRASDLGLTYVARVDVVPLGMFDDYSESDHARSPRPRLSLGAAYAFSDRDRRTRAIAGTAFADGGSMRSHNLTVDAVFKVAGLSLLLDFYWRQGWRLPGDVVDTTGTPVAVEPARNGVGWTAQLGLLIPRTRVELVARSSGVRPARRVETNLGRLDEYGGGLNYYFRRHSLKLQLDYSRAHGPGLPAGVADQLRLQLQAGF